MFRIIDRKLDDILEKLKVVKKGFFIIADYKEESRIKDIIYELQDIKNRLEEKK